MGQRSEIEMKDNLYFVFLGCVVALLIACLVFLLMVVVDFIKEASLSLTTFYPL
jgi:hypothetical protein